MTGPQVFEETLNERGPLIDAYNLVPDPKPSLGAVIDYVKKGKLRATTVNGVLFVASVIGFAEELEALMKERRWHPAMGMYMADAPEGFDVVLHFLRDRVSYEAGRRVGLFTKNGKAVTLSTTAKSLILAGDLPSALKGSHGAWIARTDELEKWLRRNWKVEAK